MKAIADTGVLVAFGNRADTHHTWAVQLAQQATTPWISCEAVLAETAFHLGDAQLVVDFVTSGLVRLDFSLAEHVQRIAEIANRYKDRQPDLADLCLIRMSELNPKHSVMTTDLTDFRIYRRNRREMIPLVYPSKTAGN